jgi:hypothetical protein
MTIKNHYLRSNTFNMEDASNMGGQSSTECSRSQWDDEPCFVGGKREHEYELTDLDRDRRVKMTENDISYLFGDVFAGEFPGFIAELTDRPAVMYYLVTNVEPEFDRVSGLYEVPMVIHLQSVTLLIWEDIVAIDDDAKRIVAIDGYRDNLAPQVASVRAQIKDGLRKAYVEALRREYPEKYKDIGAHPPVRAATAAAVAPERRLTEKDEILEKFRRNPPELGTGFTLTGSQHGPLRYKLVNWTDSSRGIILWGQRIGDDNIPQRDIDQFEILSDERVKIVHVESLNRYFLGKTSAISWSKY